jgi:hypothetical protein
MPNDAARMFVRFIRLKPDKPGAQKMADPLGSITRHPSLSGFAGLSGISGVPRSNARIYYDYYYL